MSASIDWRYWQILPEVQQWEACALSLGIDPESMRRHPQAWMAGGPGAGPMFTAASFPNREAETEFQKRRRLLEASVFTSGFFPTVRGLVMGARWKATIRLDEFASWGAHVGLHTPPELCALPAPVPPELKLPADVVLRPISRAVAQDAAILAEIRRLGHDPLNLPENDNGMPGVRAEIIKTMFMTRKDIFVSVKVCETTWQRLRNQGEICNK